MKLGKRIRIIGLCNTSEKVKEDIAVIFFCVSYILALIFVLKPNLMSGEDVVTSYHKSFSIAKSVLAVITAFIIKHITCALVKKNGTFSYYIVRILLFLFELPVVLSLGLFEFDNYYIFWFLEIVYWLILCFVVAFLDNIQIRTVKTLGTRRKKRFIRITILLVVVVGLLYSYRKIGSVSMSFSLSGIYRIRAAFKDNTNELITFFKTAGGGYLCPCFIVYYCAKKKYAMSILMIILQCLFYFMARDKTYLFLMPAALGIGLFSQAISHSFTKYLRWGYGIYGIALLFTVVGCFRNMIFEIITRRIQVMPTFFNYIYFDFFSQNEPIWWRQDTFLIDKLFSVVYPRSIPLQISHVYFHDLEGNPNAGMFAEAISRCGYLGVLIYPLLLGSLICIVNHVYRKTSREIQLILAICFAMSISNDVITSTSFVMVTIIVLLGSRFFKRDNACYENIELIQRIGIKV